MIFRLLEPVEFQTFKIFLSPICCAVYAGSKGLLVICVYGPKTKIVKQNTVFVIYSPYKKLIWLLSSGLDTRNGFFLMALIAEQSSNLNYSRRPQLFRLRLKLKSTSANATIRWRVVLQLTVATLNFWPYVSDPISGKRFYHNQDSFTCEDILNCLSGRLARNLFCIPVFPISILDQLQITE